MHMSRYHAHCLIFILNKISHWTWSWQFCLSTLASQQAPDLCHHTRNLQGAGQTKAASTFSTEPSPDSPSLLFLLSDTISFSSAIDFRLLNKLELSPDSPRSTANNLAKAPSGSCWIADIKWYRLKPLTVRLQRDSQPRSKCPARSPKLVRTICSLSASPFSLRLSPHGGLWPNSYCLGFGFLNMP